ncbi:MAG: GNAT family N-acetyltransferase [Pseudomonadota bacterium]
MAERQNKQVIETEQGFATYFYIQDGVYIEDIFTSPEHRHSNVASKMADSIAEEAKSKGYSKMYGTVLPSANHSTESLKVLLAYGFRLDSSANNAIILVKEI